MIGTIMAEIQATVIPVDGECGAHMMGKSLEDPFHCEETLRKSTNHWYAPLSNYLSKGIIPPAMNYEERKTFFTQIKTFKWEDPFLYREFSTGSSGGVRWSTNFRQYW